MAELRPVPRSGGIVVAGAIVGRRLERAVTTVGNLISPPPKPKLLLLGARARASDCSGLNHGPGVYSAPAAEPEIQFNRAERGSSAASKAEAEPKAAARADAEEGREASESKRAKEDDKHGR